MTVSDAVNIPNPSALRYSGRKRVHSADESHRAVGICRDEEPADQREHTAAKGYHRARAEGSVLLASAAPAPGLLSQVAKAITGTNWNGHRFFGLKAVRTGSNRKRNVTPRPDSLLDIGVSPTLAGFAPAMPDRSPPLATKESDSASPNESAWRPSCEGGPTVRQIGSRKDPRSDPREFPREAQPSRKRRRLAI